MENNFIYLKYLKYKKKYIAKKNSIIKQISGSDFDEEELNKAILLSLNEVSEDEELERAMQESLRFHEETSDKTNKFSATEFMLKNLANNNHEIVKVPSDGNCFFHALSYSLPNLPKNTHQELRKRLWQSFKSRNNELGEELVKEDDNLKNDKAWIEFDYQIERMAELLKRPIHIYQNHPENGTVRIFNNSSKNPIFIVHYTNALGHGLHYDAVKKIN